jgi:hypothetical protein
MAAFDPTSIKVCVDRIHPRDLDILDRAAQTRSAEDEDRLRMAIVTGKKWDPGRTITVSFLDGLPEVQERVVHFARMWEDHANLRLNFGNHTPAEVRISFEDVGSWSYLGVDALGIRDDLPTMNYGWLAPEVSDREYERVVIHEFGHAFGAIHEHQHPDQGIPWDKEKVYAYYMGPPNNWTREQVDHNLFRRYSRTITQFSEFDPDSIMLYSVPNELTLGDFEIGWNTTLSDTDKAFIAEAYPGSGTTIDAVRIDVGRQPVEASIGEPGEEDRFVFSVSDSGRYRMETQGFTDVVMTLHGPGTLENMVAADDDSGAWLNSRIEANLQPGDYYLSVRHYNERRVGSYKVEVIQDR